MYCVSIVSDRKEISDSTEIIGTLKKLYLGDLPVHVYLLYSLFLCLHIDSYCQIC